MEMLIVIAITALIGAVITAATSSIWNVSAMSVNRVDAVKQVENAIHWMSRDVQMAQIVQDNVGSGFPLSLTWVEWGNTTNQATYFLQGDELHRSFAVNGVTLTNTVIAQPIDSHTAMTWCSYDRASKVLTLQVTSSVGGFRGASETREVLVVPRSGI